MRGVMILRKSALVLSLICLMTMFVFVGCGGNNDNNGTTDNGTVVEEHTDNLSLIHI